MAIKQIVHLFDVNRSIGYLEGNAFCGTTTGVIGEPDLGLARQKVAMGNGGFNPPADGFVSTNSFTTITSPDNTRTYNYNGQSVEYLREAVKISPSAEMILKRAAFILAEFDDVNPVPRFEPSDRLAYQKRLPFRIGVTHTSPSTTCVTGSSCLGLTFIMLPFLNPNTGIVVKNYNWDNGFSGIAQIGFCFAVGRDVKSSAFVYMPMAWLENNKMINCRNSNETDTSYIITNYNDEPGCYYVIIQSFPANHEHYIYIDILESGQHSVRFISKSNPELYDYRYTFTGEKDRINENFLPSIPYVFGAGFIAEKHNHEGSVHKNVFKEFIHQNIHRL